MREPRARCGASCARTLFLDEAVELRQSLAPAVVLDALAALLEAPPRQSTPAILRRLHDLARLGHWRVERRFGELCVAAPRLSDESRARAHAPPSRTQRRHARQRLAQCVAPPAEGGRVLEVAVQHQTAQQGPRLARRCSDSGLSGGSHDARAFCRNLGADRNSERLVAGHSRHHGGSRWLAEASARRRACD
jgi:hypothetical protein